MALASLGRAGRWNLVAEQVGLGEDGAMDVLYLAASPSATSEALRLAARERNVTVIDFRAPSDVIGGGIAHGYGGPRFMARLAQTVDLQAVEPIDTWLTELPQRFLLRQVKLMSLAEAQRLTRPAFVKAPREKDLEPGVYLGYQLPSGPLLDSQVLVSDVVRFTREYRLLVLDGQVVTGSRYLLAGRPDACPLEADIDPSAVMAFAADLLGSVGDTLPSAVTVDVGWAINEGLGIEGFAVVEANMAWFSNIYACDPSAALDVVLRSSGPAASFRKRDRRFVRIGNQPEGCG